MVVVVAAEVGLVQGPAEPMVGLAGTDQPAMESPVRPAVPRQRTVARAAAAAALAVRDRRRQARQALAALAGLDESS